MRISLCLVSLIALALSPALRADEIKPAATPVAWELQIKTTNPARIVVDTGGGPKAYWYVLYTVTNNTGQDVDFLPDIVRVSEIESELPAKRAEAEPDKAPKLIAEPAIVGIHPKVFEAVKALYAKTHPFLVSPVDAIGKVLQGRDNARTSVAIFPDLDPKASKFTLYVGGLSGERVTKPNPMYDPKKASKSKPKDGGNADDDNPKFFVLQKTLALPFTLPGDVNTRRTATAVLGKMTWVMR